MSDERIKAALQKILSDPAKKESLEKMDSLQDVYEIFSNVESGFSINQFVIYIVKLIMNSRGENEEMNKEILVNSVSGGKSDKRFSKALAAALGGLSFVPMVGNYASALHPSTQQRSNIKKTSPGTKNVQQQPSQPRQPQPPKKEGMSTVAKAGIGTAIALTAGAGTVYGIGAYNKGPAIWKWKNWKFWQKDVEDNTDDGKVITGLVDFLTNYDTKSDEDKIKFCKERMDEIIAAKKISGLTKELVGNLDKFVAFIEANKAKIGEKAESVISIFKDTSKAVTNSSNPNTPTSAPEKFESENVPGLEKGREYIRLEDEVFIGLVSKTEPGKASDESKKLLPNLSTFKVEDLDKNVAMLNKKFEIPDSKWDKDSVLIAKIIVASLSAQPSQEGVKFYNNLKANITSFKVGQPMVKKEGSGSNTGGTHKDTENETKYKEKLTEAFNKARKILDPDNNKITNDEIIERVNGIVKKAKFDGKTIEVGSKLEYNVLYCFVMANKSEAGGTVGEFVAKEGDVSISPLDSTEKIKTFDGKQFINFDYSIVYYDIKAEADKRIGIIAEDLEINSVLLPAIKRNEAVSNFLGQKNFACDACYKVLEFVKEILSSVSIDNLDNNDLNSKLKDVNEEKITNHLLANSGFVYYTVNSDSPINVDEALLSSNESDKKLIATELKNQFKVFLGKEPAEMLKIVNVKKDSNKVMLASKSISDVLKFVPAAKMGSLVNPKKQVNPLFSLKSEAEIEKNDNESKKLNADAFNFDDTEKSLKLGTQTEPVEVTSELFLAQALTKVLATKTPLFLEAESINEGDSKKDQLKLGTDIQSKRTSFMQLISKAKMLGVDVQLKVKATAS